MSSTRVGRPTTGGIEGQKATLGIRASADLKTRLIKAAKRNGRSLSAEAEIRLEQSFYSEGLVEEGQRLAQRLAYGEQGVELIQLFSRMVRHGPGARGLDIEENWAADPVAFSIIEREITHTLKRLRPPGDPLPEADRSPEDRVDRLLVGLNKISPPDEWKEG